MSLLQQISDLTAKGPGGLEEADRAALVQASMKLAEALESPFEKFFRWSFGVYETMALRLAIDMNLPDVSLAHGGPITCTELAKKSGVDEDLLLRILRMVVPLGVFAESGLNTFVSTPFTPMLATGSPLREAFVHFTHVYGSTAAMPAYFAANGWKNPTDSGDTPFQFSERCKGQTYFDFLAKPENKRYADAFNMTMSMQKGSEDESFPQCYPAQERLSNDDPERVLFVDVGGSIGHQVRKFHEAYSSIPGKLVLEDLPEVVRNADGLPSSIIKLGHDFFKPQPDVVRNAKAFYLRTVLHDWGDTQAIAILSQIVDVMADDSVIILHESVLPETGVTLTEAKLDFHMLNMGALERTEKQWAKLADDAGLKINGIWFEVKGEQGRRGFIELSKKS